MARFGSSRTCLAFDVTRFAKSGYTDEFYRTIEAVLTLHERLRQMTQMPAIFNAEEALERLGNDVEIPQQLAAQFFNTAPHLMAAMRRAITKDDPYNLDFAAHRIRGAASNLSAHAVIEMAERLELIACVRNMSQAERTVAVLEDEVERFKAVFCDLQQSWQAKS